MGIGGRVGCFVWAIGILIIGLLSPIVHLSLMGIHITDERLGKCSMALNNNMKQKIKIPRMDLYLLMRVTTPALVRLYLAPPEVRT